MRTKQRLYATALEASLANLEIARVRHRPWRPWRSPQESWQIRHLVWQWFTYRFYFRIETWSARALARWLGVYHRHVQKLIGEFASNPAKMWREARESGYRVATFEQLEEAREITRQMRARDLLRSPTMPQRKMKVQIGTTVVQGFEPRKDGARLYPAQVPRETLPWATSEYSMLLANSGLR